MNQELHPQVVELLSTVFRQPAEAVSPSVEQMRRTNDKLLAPLIGPGEDVARVWNEMIDGACGGVPVRCYLAGDSQPTLIVVYVHGGGWVTGTVESYDALCRAMAVRSNALVMSVGYGLSPESQFPGAVEQVLDVLRGVRSWAHSANFEDARFAVAGDSAGAQIIGAALHRLATREELMPAAAVFIYPVTDASMRQESWNRFGDGYRLTRAVMEWYWEQYAGCTYSELQARARDPEISPLYSPNLAAYPRSLIVTAAFDPLRDEGAEFANRLRDSGVDAEFIEVPGQIHGFLRFRQAFTDPQWGADAVMTRICSFLAVR